MAEFEPFTFVVNSNKEESGLFGEYSKLTSSKVADIDVQLVTALRAKHTDLIVTTVLARNVSLLNFAFSGNATAELDTESETVIRWRGYIGPTERGGTGSLGEAVFFAKYHYKWGTEDFIVYYVVIGYNTLQYILKEPRSGETTHSNSSITDALIATIGQWASQIPDAVYVYDRYWYRSSALWEEVQKASWDKVILDPDMKKSLTDVSEKFFDSKDIYEEYGVPWKRGLIFYGPAGNGKTISIKALMRTLSDRKQSVPTLYVKSAPSTYNIREIFALARAEAPCLLVMEDIDTIVTEDTRAYFFNEVDGLENNNGILMLATTNHLDKLDPGLSKRPSRFDRKYLFPNPSEAERILYCDFWRHKMVGKPVDFPEKLCPAIAGITDGFSFAYLQEAFMASLLVIAHNHEDDNAQSSCEPNTRADLNKYELWRVIKQQVKILRHDMETETPGNDASVTSPQIAKQGDIAQGDDPIKPAGIRSLGKAEELKLETAFRGEIPIFNRQLTTEELIKHRSVQQKEQSRDWEFMPRFV
ncbi:P-loop containing nucleoside triphosphate hydrolase protein [Tothia fuscella]|uniref:P-loop containing nucleoside triphosphate hydrolase protein n=1 Tax=Tothia fuscella TaxID=1048955 RepID=A0A9P4U332_9PEZI|nr:P-loop containing nucleoside triphosphate hydrolase protein [Tothia fuscella]